MAVVDPTVWGLGRDIPRMQRIAAQTPVNIVVAAGLYVYEELPQQYRGPARLDLFNPGAERVKTIAIMAARGYAGSMVLSHDANCFIDYFGAAHDDVLPALLAHGVSQAQIDTMMIENPVRYFTRKAS